MGWVCSRHVIEAGYVHGFFMVGDFGQLQYTRVESGMILKWT